MIDDGTSHTMERSSDRTRTGDGWSLAALVARFESGRRPHLVALGTTGALILLAPLRFAILMRVMTPADYGLLSVFNTLTSLLPFVVLVGLPLEIQRVTAIGGTQSLRNVSRRLTGVIAVMSVPAIAAATALTASLDPAVPALMMGIQTIAVAAPVAASIALSQMLLGVGSRSAAVLTLFGYNVMLTISAVPLLLIPQPVTPSIVMITWAGSASVGVLLGLVLLRAVLARVPRSAGASAVPDGPRLEVRRGLSALPALIGTWSLVLVTRWGLGVFGGHEALATFALAWTLSDLAFLAAASLSTVSSTSILLGQRDAMSVFAAASAVLLALVASGSVGLVVYVNLVAPEYVVSLGATAAMVAAAIVRLAMVTWLPRAVSADLQGRVSLAYVVAVALLSGVVLIAKPGTAEDSAVLLTAGLCLVGLIQGLAMTHVFPRQPDRLAT